MNTTLSQSHELSRKNNHRNLTPSFDPEWGVIRVVGILGQSPYTVSKKFPVLISNQSQIVSLLLGHIQEAALHVGAN